jgi:hypothetical protein
VTDSGISRIIVEGYKSLRARHEIAIRPLTVLAGVNSAGKSSAMQPLLLLKQTLETSYDPGPLQLSGPNVDITAIEQVLSKPTASNGRASWFKTGVAVSGRDTEWKFGKDEKNDLRLFEMTGWFFPDQGRPLTLREGMREDELLELLPRGVRQVTTDISKSLDGVRLGVSRDRCFLLPGLGRGKTTPLTLGPLVDSIKQELPRMIHLPALRGNPRRTYRTVAVEDRYPATFETYTAGVIAAWQNREDTDRLGQLRADVEELSLTSQVAARQLDDTQVELMVGRLPQARRAGDNDLVNIADVGFGVSQTLPVIVALLAASPGQLVYLEQPEIHLHPRAQVSFASLLQRAVERRVRVVVETHSALLVRALQTLVAKQELQPEDVLLHWFSRDPQTGDTEIATAELDEAGAFGDWPEDFDEVYLESESRYLDAAAEASRS